MANKHEGRPSEKVSRTRRRLITSISDHIKFLMPDCLYPVQVIGDYSEMGLWSFTGAVRFFRMRILSISTVTEKAIAK